MEEESKLTKLILSPQLCGVYISKSDLQSIASNCGYSLQVQERKRMLVEIFAQVQGVDDFVRIVDSVISFAKYKKELYENIQNEYKSATQIVKTITDKIEDAINELERTKEEAALIA